MSVEQPAFVGVAVAAPDEAQSRPTHRASSNTASSHAVSTRASVARVRGLSRAFREGNSERSVLDNVDLNIQRGEIIALLGRSGSGKSTLLNLLGGIDLPDAGQIWIGEQEITGLDETRRTLLRRDRIGFIFQFFNLIPTLTVEENLLLPLELSGRLDPEHRSAALDRLETLGLGDRASTFPDRLSGGEQQRVAIARALAHQPDLLLADEPTGNLDAETGSQVLDLLQLAVRDAGATLVMATHSRTAARIADRVLTVRDGGLYEA